MLRLGQARGRVLRLGQVSGRVLRLGQVSGRVPLLGQAMGPGAEAPPACPFFIDIFFQSFLTVE